MNRGLPRPAAACSRQRPGLPAGAEGCGHVEFGIVAHQEQLLRPEAKPLLDRPEERGRLLSPAEFLRGEHMVGQRERFDHGGDRQ